MRSKTEALAGAGTEHGAVVRPVISCVAPVYNEEANVEPLCRRLAETFAKAGIDDYEVVLVENGSWDGSEEAIRREHARNPRIKMLQLSRNFGYQGGISAGLAHAKGDFVCVLDGDQQDPPELIPELLAKAKEGFDVVYGIRKKRREGPHKRLAYAAFYRLWKATAQIKVPLDAGDFCVMHRRVVKALVAMPERQRFVRGLRAWSGFKQTGVEYSRDARGEGETKFRLRGMIALALDGILSYSVVPLRMMTFSGIGVAAFSFLVGLVQASFRLASWLGFHAPKGVLPPGLTQINLLITFLIGFNILAVGIVGEYAGRIYEEVKRRPIFLVREKLFGEDDDGG